MTATSPATDQAPQKNASRVPRVVVIVLMYRVPEQAIECLSSLLASTHSDFRIILLDNASPEGAFEKVRLWARGAVAPPAVRAHPLNVAHLFAGPVDHAELAADAPVNKIASLRPLTLVQTGVNLGYAGGNNVALKWLQAATDWDYAWILNPDTVVDPEAMSALAARSEQDPTLGPVGARICFYDRPDMIQQWGGGAYRRWRGTGRLIGFARHADESVDTDAVERSLDYITGASLFLPRAFLDRAGLMDERYFLYFEEVDWCRRRGSMRLGYAHDALVYHHHGGSIGSASSYKEMSPTAIRWTFRNRMVFTRKFFPWALLTVYLTITLDIARMIRKRAFANAWLAFKVVHGIERVSPPQSAQIS